MTEPQFPPTPAEIETANVPTLAEYAEIIDKLADALGGPATGRDALPAEMHRAYYDAVDRAGLRRVVAAMNRAHGAKS